MKLVVTILLITLLAVTGSSAQQSSTAIPITATDCLQNAIDTAKNAIVGAELYAMGTLTGKVGLLGDVAYDYRTGKAELWIYQFRSKFDGTPVVVVAFKSALNNVCLAGVINDADTSKVPIVPIKENWKNSSEIESYFQKNNLYQLMRNIQYPNAITETLSLVSSEALNDDTAFPPNTTIWVGVMAVTSTQKMICAFDAVKDGETICAAVNVPTSVEQDPVAATQPYINPQPAKDLALLTIPTAETAPVREVLVYDLQGNKVMNASTMISGMTERTIVLPVQHLAPALYMVRVVTNNQAYTVPMLIER